jgi:hypothetical protein
MNADIPIYDLSTGEHMPTVDREVCSLVYCIDRFELPEVSTNYILAVEIYKVSSVEEALRNYIEEERHDFNGKPYSHFFVLHDNICDLYIVGNNLLKHYDDMDYDEDDHGRVANINFWLFRARYHKSMFIVALDRILLQQPTQCSNAVEFAEIDVDHAQPLDTLLGHQVIGYNTWECCNLPECCEPHEESVTRGVERLTH